MDETSENIRKTKNKFGYIYPVLTDKKGNIIDGYHRKEVDPNWPTIAIEADEIKSQMIALVANINRRDISPAEITKRLDTIASLTNWTPTKIAEELGMSYPWVMKYISQAYKNTIKAEQIKNGISKSIERASIRRIDATDSGSFKMKPAYYDSMTEKESVDMDSIQGRKIVVVVPKDIITQLEKEATSHKLDIQHMVLKIIRNWLKRR